MRTIVVDDEQWMLKRFAIECEGLPDVQLLGSFRNPLKALDFAAQNAVDLAFLDMEMPELNGIQLAQKLKEINPNIIVIFISAYDSYMTDAFRTKVADYYIMKPYNSEDIEAAVDRARLLSGRLRKAIFAQTFGKFELFSAGKPIAFQDESVKELLAMLVDRQGNRLTAQEASALLWPELSPSEGAIIVNRTMKHLMEDLSALHLDGIVEKEGLTAIIHTDVIDCDLYKLLDGDPKVARQYSGEYMVGYDWAKDTREKLDKQYKLLSLFRDAQARNSLCANIRTLDNPERTIRYMNDAFLAMVGYTRREIEQLFQNSFRAMVIREYYDNAQSSVRKHFDKGRPVEVQYQLVEKNDADVWVICMSEPPKAVDDGMVEISSVLIDISETKAENQMLEKAAYCDSLTGLCNRSFAQKKIEQYLASTEFQPVGALVILDVDSFKAVNDTYGHPFADTVLTDIAAILSRSVRSSDIVCRLGGDEMMVFLKGTEGEETAREKLKAIMYALGERLSTKTQNGEISCSFGGAMYPSDGSSYEELYENADKALYKAKINKNCAVWFEDMKADGDKA